MNQFQTLKSDLTQSRIIDIDSPAIDNGEIAVRIESYAFTANNVTYGVAGDTIGYWKFFPAEHNENNQNKYIKGIKALYRKTTTQQTKQKINCAKPQREKNL